jgi:hypothetical protein
MDAVKAGYDPRQIRDPHTGEWVDALRGLTYALGKMAKELKEAVRGRMDTLIERYPNVRIEGVRLWDLPGANIAGHGHTAFGEEGHQTIKLDRATWEPKGVLERFLDRYWSHFADPTPEGMVTHEFGHIAW